MTPGQADNAQSNLFMAGQALRVAKMALDAGAREDAASRLYYAVYHAAHAALMVRGLYSKTHSGQITLFEATFGATPLLGKLFELRLDADYLRKTFTTTAEELEGRLAEGAAFVERCRAVVAEATAAGPDEADPPPDY